MNDYNVLIQFSNPNIALLQDFYFSNISSKSEISSGGFDAIYCRFDDVRNGFVMRNFTFEGMAIFGRDALINIVTQSQVIPQNVFWENFNVFNSNFYAAVIINLKLPDFSTLQIFTAAVPYYFRDIKHFWLLL